MLDDIIKQMTKIKKKHGAIPVLYMYSEASELSLANIKKVCLAYTDLEIDGSALIYSNQVNDENFISEKEYNAEKHTEFKPVVLISENI